MLTIWGRANSINVQKVMWCCHELGLAFERIDAGMQYGRTQDPAYLALNPNAKVPTIQDGDFSLWESNSIMRYLVLQYAPGSSLYPLAPRETGSVNKWLDWALGTMQPTERNVFWGLVRTPPAERDASAIAQAKSATTQLWQLVEGHLNGAPFLEGSAMTLADMALGAYARRWFMLVPESEADLPDVANWYRGLAARPAFGQAFTEPLT